MRLKVITCFVIAMATLAGTCQAEDHAKAWMDYLVGTWSFTTDGGNTGDFVIEKSALETVHTVTIVQADGRTIVVGMYAWDKDTGVIHIARGTATDAKVFTFSRVTEDKLLTDDKSAAYLKIDANKFKIEVNDGNIFATLTRKK